MRANSTSSLLLDEQRIQALGVKTLHMVTQYIVTGTRIRGKAGSNLRALDQVSG